MKKEVKTRTVDIWKALPVVRAIEDATERDDDDDVPLQPQTAPAPSGRGTRSLERSASTTSSGAMTGAPTPGAVERAKSITATVAQAKVRFSLSLSLFCVQGGMLGGGSLSCLLGFPLLCLGFLFLIPPITPPTHLPPLSPHPTLS
jgi:hypothetical protein